MKYPMLQKCVYFSDGVGSQYKNYKTFTNFSTMNQILAPMLSGISLRPLMGKALVTILEVLSNALLIIRAFGLCKNQLILCKRCLSGAETTLMPLNLYLFLTMK